ncbi:MAG: aminotransferase class I/II-fold pyridoxal phosphate-dependent enzyme [Gemmatimonadota bacterium]
MSFESFELERWQSDFEHAVEYNLADSSVRGAPLSDVLPADAMDRFMALELGYPQVNGTDALRRRIAGLYRGATPDNVLVTVGGAEANQLVCQTLLEPGDECIVMEPGYRQVWGLARNLGAVVRPFSLRADRGWRPDLEQLARAITPRTKLIAVVNPNNPTGTILNAADRAAIVEIARRAGVWLLADEVYRGAERLTDAETPSFFGDYERVVAVNSLSKAYGLSGLRLGWAVASEDFIQALWRRHEYAVIAASAPSMFLAEIALGEPYRARLLARQRKMMRDGWELLSQWVGRNSDLVSVAPSEATAIAFVRYNLPIGSVEVADRIRREASVLVAPGEYLGADHHLRITHGLGADRVVPALDRIAEVLSGLTARVGQTA